MGTRIEKADYFNFMLDRIREVGSRHGEKDPQALARWFMGLYLVNPQEVFVSDGSHDGKVDAFCTTNDGKTVRHHVINAKFTKEFNKLASPFFYEEISYFYRAFEKPDSRDKYLAKAVKEELRPHYRRLFKLYDEERAELIFVSNHKRNDGYYAQVENLPLKVVHLDELLQFIVDDIDGAMPRTPPLALNGIHGLLAPDKADTEVSTSIVFARLIDFLRYMEDDPYDLLFMRNVRVPISLSKSRVNKDVRDTFRDSPREFAFSSNGITMLCEKRHYDIDEKILTIENPRVVNGSQTLHSIRDVADPSPNARVMVRIITIEGPRGDDLPAQVEKRKDVISKIAVRTNQQNPIKKWDLVSNDDFQLEIYRFFRRRNYFYERREREWHQRSRGLKSIGVHRGPSIKWLAQVIACYYRGRKSLGPAAARSNPGQLFDSPAYDSIRSTKPELVYQLFLLSEMIDSPFYWLAQDSRAIASLRGYAFLTLLSLVLRILDTAGAQWGHGSLTDTIEGQWNDWDPHYPKWRRLVLGALMLIRRVRRKEAGKYWRREHNELTHANFFKGQVYVDKILKGGISKGLYRAARQILNDAGKK